MNFPKLYLILASVSIVSLTTLSILSLWVLKSDLGLEIIVRRYQTYTDWLRSYNTALYILLLIISNIIYYRNSKKIFYYFTTIIFSLFCLFYWIYISEVYFHFKQVKGLWLGEFSLAGFVGIGAALLAVAVSFVNFFIMKLLKKYEK